MQVSEEFLDNLAKQSGYASGSLCAALLNLQTALELWDSMEESLREHLQKTYDTLTVDIIEIEEMRSGQGI